MEINSALLYRVLLVLLSIHRTIIHCFDDLPVYVHPDCLSLLIKGGSTISEYLPDELLDLLLVQVVAVVAHKLDFHHLHLLFSDLNFLNFLRPSIVRLLRNSRLLLNLLLFCELLLQILEILTYLVD